MLEDKRIAKGAAPKTNLNDISRASVLGNSYTGAAMGPMLNTA